MDADKIASILHDTVAPVLKDTGYPMAAETVNAACERIAELEAEVERLKIEFQYKQDECDYHYGSLCEQKAENTLLESHSREAMELLWLGQTICDGADDGFILKANLRAYILDRYKALEARIAETT